MGAGPAQEGFLTYRAAVPASALRDVSVQLLAESECQLLRRKADREELDATILLALRLASGRRMHKVCSARQDGSKTDVCRVI